jgi:hypothetical protein
MTLEPLIQFAFIELNLTTSFRPLCACTIRKRATTARASVVTLIVGAAARSQINSPRPLLKMRNSAVSGYFA